MPQDPQTRRPADATRQLLAELGCGSVDELFAEIPPELRWDQPLRVPERLAECELAARLAELATPNTHLDEATCFLGGGSYDHYVPAVVDAVAAAAGSELVGPQAPQPWLQVVLELQRLFEVLTGCECATAPFADGPTALVEAVRLAARATGRPEAVVARSVHPGYRAVARAELAGSAIELVEAGYHGGVTRPDQVERLLGDRTACLVLQHPNYFGCLEDVATLAAAAHGHGARCIVSVDPLSLGLLAPPAASGADVALADAQALGSHPAYGGGSPGLLACRGELAAELPGWRVERQGETLVAVGEARDGIRADALVRPVAYLATVGAAGLERAASLCLSRAHETQRRVCSIEGFHPRFRAPFFKEFAVESDLAPDDIAEELLQSNLLGALPLQPDYPEMDHGSLFAATERRTTTDIDMLYHALDLMADLSAELE